jgi:hypothetical protein
MARNARSKYDWPDDETLQALLDKHGTGETARKVGCPPSSLKNRIRKRGLRRAKQRREPDAANGKPEAAQSNGKPEAAESNAEPGAAESSGERGDGSVGERNPSGQGATHDEPRSRIWDMLLARPNKGPARGPTTSKEPPPRPKPSEPVRESKPGKEPEKSRSLTREPLEYQSSANYLTRVKPPRHPVIDAGFGNDDSASALHVSRTKGALAFLRRVPPPIWRVLAVVGLAAVAAIAAFISVANDPKTYERESSFAVRPSPTIPPAAVNDVLGTLAQPDSAITETIVNMFGSPRLRTFAAQSAGVSPSSVGGSGAEYEWSATRRTGSTIIDVRLTGPDDAKLRAMQTAAGPEAARLVEGSYPPYRLETLSAPSPPVQVGPKITRTVGLALLLGALLGITLVLAERRLRLTLPQREGPARAHAPRGEPWER